MDQVLTDNMEREIERRYFGRRFDRNPHRVPVGRWMRRVTHRASVRPLD